MQYVKSFSSDTGTSQINGRTERQTDRITISISRFSVLTRNKNVFNCLLNWQRLSDDCSEAGGLFQSGAPATSSDPSPRRVLDHGMTHLMAPDERRRRLISGAYLHAFERYDGAQSCSDLNIRDRGLFYTLSFKEIRFD